MFEADLAEEEEKFEELEKRFDLSREIMKDDDRAHVAQRIEALEGKWEQLKDATFQAKRR